MIRRGVRHPRARRSCTLLNRRCGGGYCTGRSQQSGRGVDADRFNKVRQWTDAEESLGLGTTAGFGEEEGARGEGSSERERAVGMRRN